MAFEKRRSNAILNIMSKFGGEFLPLRVLFHLCCVCGLLVLTIVHLYCLNEGLAPPFLHFDKNTHPYLAVFNVVVVLLSAFNFGCFRFVLAAIGLLFSIHAYNNGTFYFTHDMNNMFMFSIIYAALQVALIYGLVKNHTIIFKNVFNPLPIFVETSFLAVMSVLLVMSIHRTETSVMIVHALCAIILILMQFFIPYRTAYSTLIKTLLKLLLFYPLILIVLVSPSGAFNSKSLIILYVSLGLGIGSIVSTFFFAEAAESSHIYESFVMALGLRFRNKTTSSYKTACFSVGLP